MCQAAGKVHEMNGQLRNNIVLIYCQVKLGSGLAPLNGRGGNVVVCWSAIAIRWNLLDKQTDNEMQ